MECDCLLYRTSSWIDKLDYLKKASAMLELVVQVVPPLHCYRIEENFRGSKFRSFVWLFMKFISVKFGGPSILWHDKSKQFAKVFSTKLHFTSSKFFCYMVLYIACLSHNDLRSTSTYQNDLLIPYMRLSFTIHSNSTIILLPN